jgi:hypothetical protein
MIAAQLESRSRRIARAKNGEETETEKEDGNEKLEISAVERKS